MIDISFPHLELKAEGGFRGRANLRSAIPGPNQALVTNRILNTFRSHISPFPHGPQQHEFRSWEIIAVIPAQFNVMLIVFSASNL